MWKESGDKNEVARNNEMLREVVRLKKGTSNIKV